MPVIVLLVHLPYLNTKYILNLRSSRLLTDIMRKRCANTKEFVQNDIHTYVSYIRTMLAVAETDK